MTKLAPSILAADFSKLGEQVAQIEQAGAHFIHVDVMDGHFVPNISYGASVMKSLLGKTNLPFDVHLMIEQPDQRLEDFATENTEYITVHQEACPHLHRTITHIKDLGIKAGVCINPATPLNFLYSVLDQVDLVLIMSVNPGFGGQTFIPSVLDKIKELKAIKDRRNLHFAIEIDGGVNLDNLREIIAAGTEIIVAGSSIFGAQDIPSEVEAFLNCFPKE